MARNSYRNFLRVLEKWPLDESKTGGRDLGEHLRIRVSEAFRLGDTTPTDEADCQRVCASLNRIANNSYSIRYPRKLTSTSTGVTVQECHQITSTEFLKAIEESEKGLLSGMFKQG
ncbi:ubiquinol-cytochrome-c reductase complex assembly factor 2-like [Penaeus monodon]|uniref:ubiquinol-cytochrome-c reductase complex assembly factor 2-like n=1 Tax=Penaeus monodon TaxID=6687 RepID=UPI0018A6E031|nr:ubiquinol-cytochrome-c reductase complex assembly factor 2-like [Penaeus monodon]